MYELTEHQALEVGGGMDGVPYHYRSQRVILPTPDMEQPFEEREAPPFPPGPQPLPSFG